MSWHRVFSTLRAQAGGSARRFQGATSRGRQTALPALRNACVGGALLGVARAGWFWSSSPAPSAQDAVGGGVPGEILEEAVLLPAPQLPPPINRDHPVTLRVNLDSTVLVAPISNKYKYTLWTFNNMVPGPLIRARVGDTIEVVHTNKDPTGMSHNIDFHAVAGPGGGGPVTLAEMGETKAARFKLQSEGVFVYHCAAAPVPLHVANGMYGLLVVEPEKGLPPVDKEYYVMQSEFYYETPSLEDKNVIQECDFAAGLREEPQLVVFNGREGALTQQETLKCKTNDRVRIFFGNAGPNLISSFHIIGAVFDKVYRDGDLLSPPARNLQIAMTPPGGASVVEFSPPVPGNLTLVDHSIFRLEKGAVGFLTVSGAPRPDLYFSESPPKACPGCKLHQ